MNTYVIRRRSVGRNRDDLRDVVERSREVGDEMSDDIRWIRSYVVHEQDGSVGTVSVYQASSREKICEHAARVGLPVTEIVDVAETMLVRPDPGAVTV
jgi:hypothetical protein